MAIANWMCVSWVAYALANIPVNVTLIEREFNACQTHRNMYTPIFNRLRAIARYWSEIATFSYTLAFNAPVRSGRCDNRGECHTVGKRIQCLYNASLYIYPSIFNRFPVIRAWSLKIRHFSTFFAHFGLPCVRPWDNCGKCHTVGKRIQFQCDTFTAIHLPRLSEGRTQGKLKCAKNVLEFELLGHG